MAKIIFYSQRILILIVSYFLPLIIFAHGNSNLSIGDILTEIMASQNVTQTSQIKCEKVSDEQFEKLGEAVMDFMHPDERQHELMDQMMGGEGSQSLKAMHILMGERYLGCNDKRGVIRGMMGMPMMGNWINYPWQNLSYPMMMTNFGISSWWNVLGMIFIISFLVLIFLAILVLAKWLINQLTQESKK